MKKEETIRYLQEHHISFELQEHDPIYTMEEMRALGLPHSDRVAKNLFLRDDKKKNYYLIVIQEEKSFQMKAFQERFHTRRLGFASEEDLFHYLGLQRGAVSALGILNDDSSSVHVYLDEDFMGGIIGVHPNENTATIWLSTKDLYELIKAHGNPIEVVSF